MNSWVCACMTFDCCVKSSLSPLPCELSCSPCVFGEAHFAAQTWFCWPQGCAGENNHVSTMLGWENRNTNMAERVGRGFEDRGGSVSWKEQRLPQLFLWRSPPSSHNTLFSLALVWLAVTRSYDQGTSSCFYNGFCYPQLIVSLKCLPDAKATFSITVKIIKTKY